MMDVQLSRSVTVVLSKALETIESVLNYVVGSGVVWSTKVIVFMLTAERNLPRKTE